MQFVNPNMLFALAALAIPVLVHLFNFRKHRLVYFSNISLLKSLQQQTSKTNKLKHLVVLLLRLLAIAAIVFAFARPVFPDKNQLHSTEDNLIALYIDNSLSMQAQGRKGSLFDESCQLAREIIRSFPGNDRFVLITNDLQLSNEQSMSAEECLIEIDRLNLSNFSRPMSQMIGKINDLSASHSGPKYAFVLSDFQQTTSDLGSAVPDTNIRYQFVPLSHSTIQNLILDSCWLDSPVRYPGQVANLVVRLVNDGMEDVKNQTITLKVNGVQAVIGNTDIAAKSSSEVSMQYMVGQPGPQFAEVSMTDFPVLFDDILYYSYTVLPFVQMLEIHDGQPSQWLNLLAQGDPMLMLSSRQMLQLDFQALKTANVVFLNGLLTIPPGLHRALTDYTHEGGTVVVIPSVDQMSEGINQLLNDFGISYAQKVNTQESRVFSILPEHELFKDVFVKIPENPDYPIVRQHYPLLSENRSSVFNLIKLTNGLPFLAEAIGKHGSIFVFSVPFHDDWTDFHRNALFVPVIYRLAFANASDERLYHLLGSESSIATKSNTGNSDQIFKVRSLANTFEMIPPQRNFRGITSVLLNESFSQSGHFGLFSNDSLVRYISLNHNRDESGMTFLSQASIEEMLEKSGFERFGFLDIDSIEKGDLKNQLDHISGIWKWLVVFALLMLLGEMLVLRFWK